MGWNYFSIPKLPWCNRKRREYHCKNSALSFYTHLPETNKDSMYPPSLFILICQRPTKTECNTPPPPHTHTHRFFDKIYLYLHMFNLIKTTFLLWTCIWKTAIISFRPSLLTDELFQYTDTSWGLLQNYIHADGPESPIWYLLVFLQALRWCLH